MKKRGAYKKRNLSKLNKAKIRVKPSQQTEISTKTTELPSNSENLPAN